MVFSAVWKECSIETCQLKWCNAKNIFLAFPDHNFWGFLWWSTVLQWWQRSIDLILKCLIGWFSGRFECLQRTFVKKMDVVKQSCLLSYLKPSSPWNIANDKLYSLTLRQEGMLFWGVSGNAQKCFIFNFFFFFHVISVSRGTLYYFMFSIKANWHVKK